jgi:tripartite-type tricarboxylate transporter receptor subunit TctC
MRQDNRSNRPGDGAIMNRRDFIAGCVGLSLTVRAGDALGQSGPLTRIVFPFAAGGGGDALAVSSAARSPFLPEVPTLKENGIELVADAWYGMWLPAGSPWEFARQLSVAVAAALAKPEVKEKLLSIGLIPVGSTPEGLTQDLAANTAFWQPIVKATGYKITN